MQSATQPEKLKIELAETPEPQRARIVWRETPAEGMGKPETVIEIVTGVSFEAIREAFWGDPAFSKSKCRKVEITELKWL